jgi:hypothetical protein
LLEEEAMGWRLAGAGVVIAATFVVAGRAAANDATGWRIEALPPEQPPARRPFFYTSVSKTRHRFKIELEGARARAENWLHDAGFSLLEGRDVHGKRTYTVISGPLTWHWPALRFRTRFGYPRLSAGLDPEPNMPAVGFVLLLEQVTVEFEGLDDKELGYILMGVLRWSGQSDRVQYGIALPIALERGGSAGALLQVRVRLGR